MFIQSQVTSYKDFLLFALVAFFLASATSVITVRNPIHSILLLITVFIFGAVLLFFLNMEYFALLFLIVYVGAIVVLFLFIVMMIDLKFINDTDKFSDIFSLRYGAVALIYIQIFSAFYFELGNPLFFFSEVSSDLSTFVESNFFIDYSKTLRPVLHLKALGFVIFSGFKLSVVLIALLLFLCMIGAILLAFPNKPLTKNNLYFK